VAYDRRFILFLLWFYLGFVDKAKDLKRRPTYRGHRVRGPEVEAPLTVRRPNLARGFDMQTMLGNSGILVGARAALDFDRDVAEARKPR
jgi:hypothetical protein